MRNPVSGDFFSQDAIEDASEALVREAVQNSLDAARAGQQVVVRLRVIESLGRLAQNRIGKILEGLEPHLLAQGNGLLHPPGIFDCERYAVVEDFGTTGLEGDPSEWDPDAGAKNDFFAFFRAEGYSSKEGEDRGRWGVGKTVFPRSSQINAFFGVTRTQRHAHTLAMGRCILKMHKVDGISYVPDGYFGEHDRSIVLPASTQTDLGQLEAAFEITRRRADMTGLSVIIPFLDESITADTLLRAAVRDYFHPLLAGTLVIEIAANDNVWQLSAETVKLIAKDKRDVIGPEILPIIELAEWALHVQPAPILIEPPDGGSPQWDAAQLPEETVEAGRAVLAKEARQAFRCNLTVRPKDGPAKPSFFSVYLSNAGDQDRRRPVFVRDGIVITNAAGTTLRGRHALVTIEDLPLAALLGDAENVAHTEWNKDRSLFGQKYVHAKSYLSYVRKAAAEVVRLLTEGDVERDPDLLQDILSIVLPPDDHEQDEDAAEGRDAKGKRKTPRPRGWPARPQRFRIERLQGGFAVHPGDPEAEPLGHLQIRVAYDTNRGNPLKAWHPADFRLDQRPVEVTAETGCSIQARADNQITMRIDSPQFRFSVTGFDPKRDLYVRALPLSDGTDR